jgi:hypothetical protein
MLLVWSQFPVMYLGLLLVQADLHLIRQQYQHYQLHLLLHLLHHLQ